MKLLSIDVGMKCLAYCLFSVDNQVYSIDKWCILDLCNDNFDIYMTKFFSAFETVIHFVSIVII